MFSRISFCALSAALLFSVNVTAKVVTEKNAESVAKNFMSSKGFSDKVLVLFNASGDQNVLRAPSFESPAYHIFKDAKSNDFIVVSGDDIARPILGYSFGNETEIDGELPPSMKEWLDNMEKQILRARSEGLGQSAEIARQWGDPGIGDVVKQLNTAKWNQYAPYNLQCPLKDGIRCLTGCTATSFAILMKYYGFPSAGKGVTPGYTCANTGVHVDSRNLNHPYYWDSMPLEYTDYTMAQGDSVAQLMADIGAAIQAEYSTNETTAYYKKGALYKYFGIFLGDRKNKADFSTEDWNTLLRNSLDNNRPVLYTGRSTEGLGGHSFIIDGYTDQDYFCVNWGWGGQFDGAYALNALDLSWIDYQDDQAAYFVFQEVADTLPVVAVVSDTIECPSLDAAISMVPSNKQPTVIRLVDSCRIDESYIARNQNIVLDLNGFTLEVEYYGIYNSGTLMITDNAGGGKMKTSNGNHEMISNYGDLTIQGGEFINQAELQGSTTDYRRCIWAESGSSTYIKDGKFTSVSQAICSRGKMKIDDGTFETTGSAEAIVNASVTDTTTINGGVFKATYTSDGNSMCLWTTQGTTTMINGGSFTSTKAVVYLQGNLNIDDGEYESTGNSSVITNYSGNLTIKGGTFKNLSVHDEGTNYRRCIWTSADSKSLIKDGQFKTTGQAVCTNGKLKIDGGEFESLGTGEVIVNNAVSDTVFIDGGTFKNLSGDNNQIVCLRSNAETMTLIGNGNFKSSRMVIYTRGKLTINNGYFETIGNTAVITNYATDTLTINGGTFKNTMASSSSPDYRRAVWTSEGTKTHITDGDFSSKYQVLTFNGEAIIDGGTIENTGDGYGCLSAGKVVINYCKMKALRLVTFNDGSSLKCFGGLYSRIVSNAFLGGGCVCEKNTDSATNSKYPYKVRKTVNGIDIVEEDSGATDVHYDLNGMILPDNDNEPGLHIIRKADGRTIKVLYK